MGIKTLTCAAIVITQEKDLSKMSIQTQWHARLWKKTPLLTYLH